MTENLFKIHAPKVIRSSNLSLRFYAKDGWTLQELHEIAPFGGAMCCHPNDPEPYFTFARGGQVNVDNLLERCSELDRRFNDQPRQSDRQFCVDHL